MKYIFILLLPLFFSCKKETLNIESLITEFQERNVVFDVCIKKNDPKTLEVTFTLENSLEQKYVIFEYEKYGENFGFKPLTDKIVSSGKDEYYTTIKNTFDKGDYVAVRLKGINKNNTGFYSQILLFRF